MNLSFDCPSCRRKLQVPTRLAGKTGKCPACGSPVTVPSEDYKENVPTFAVAVVQPEVTNVPSMSSENTPRAVLADAMNSPETATEAHGFKLPTETTQRWWVAVDGRTEGPRTAAYITAAVQAGQLALTTQVCLVGDKEWKPLTVWPELAAATIKDEPPNVVSSAPLVETGKRFLQRVIRSDFGRVQADQEERRRLATAVNPIEVPLAQDYAAWRRAMLGVAAAAMTIDALIATWQFELLPSDVGPYNRGVFGIYMGLVLLSQCGGAALCGWAAYRWFDVRTSRRYARLAWMTTFLVPAIFFVVPIGKLLDLPGREAAIFGGMMSFGVFLSFAPKVVGLFPGMLRACLTLKTLLPESAIPGWMAVLVSPIYSLFFLIALMTSVHLNGSFRLSIGFLLLTLAPLVYVFRSRDLARSHDETTGRRLVRHLRRTALVTTLVGLVLLIWQMLLWIDLGSISLLDIVSVATAVLSSVLLLTVVGADVILALLHQAFMQSREFDGTQSQTDLEAKLVALAAVGLADLAAGEVELARQLRTSVGDAARKGLDWAAGRDLK